MEGDYVSEEDDDSSIGGDLDSDDGDGEEGEDEIEEDLSDDELAALEKQEKTDREDMENQGGPDSMPVKSGKSEKKGALGKRKRPPVDLVYEEEHETERVTQKRRSTN